MLLVLLGGATQEEELMSQSKLYTPCRRKGPQRKLHIVCGILRKVGENAHCNLGDIMTPVDPAVVGDFIDDRASV